MLEKQLYLEKERQRKRETRYKIELGGLVIKAGLNHYDKAVILGILAQAVEYLEREPELEKITKMKGERLFMGFE